VALSCYARLISFEYVPNTIKWRHSQVQVQYARNWTDIEQVLSYKISFGAMVLLEEVYFL
jgi:hypothetical protein